MFCSKIIWLIHITKSYHISAKQLCGLTDDEQNYVKFLIHRARVFCDKFRVLDEFKRYNNVVDNREFSKVEYRADSKDKKIWA